jgi:hypothetical protein
VKRQPLSEETIDGLIFEAQLASNPKIIAKRDAFWAKVKAFREKTSGNSKAQMIAELKAHCLAYLLHLLEASSEAAIRDRYVMTFVHMESSQ